MRGGDRLVRWTTTLSVVVLAVIAAMVSYKHMFVLVHRYGESSWTAALLPLSVDGMIVASSMSLLASSRRAEGCGVLPWALLMIGSAASLSANVAVAEPSAVGRLIAAWPSAALIGSYELLMRQVRQPAGPGRAGQVVVSYGAHTADDDLSYEHADDPHADLFGTPITSEQIRATSEESPESSYGAQTERPERSLPAAGERERCASLALQRQAWQWALANRTPQGDLPSGKAIAERFARRERWGRLVKEAGRSGGFDRPSHDAYVSPPGCVHGRDE